jgi:hypothetical protein
MLTFVYFSLTAGAFIGAILDDGKLFEVEWEKVCRTMVVKSEGVVASVAFIRMKVGLEK